MAFDGMDEELATVLFDNGYRIPEDIAKATMAELTSFIGVTEEKARTLINGALRYLANPPELDEVHTEEELPEAAEEEETLEAAAEAEGEEPPEEDEAETGEEAEAQALDEAESADDESVENRPQA